MPDVIATFKDYLSDFESDLEKDFFKKFMEHLQVAREEDKLVRTVLSQLGYALPDLCAKR